MIKFEINKTYYCNSICDSDCKMEYTITKRSSKSVWINEKRFKINISLNDGNEFIYPEGKYSMCPILRAERVVNDVKIDSKAIENKIDTIALEPIHTHDNVININDYRKVI
jgi:hypothetical protein